MTLKPRRIGLLHLKKWSFELGNLQISFQAEGKVTNCIHFVTFLEKLAGYKQIFLRAFVIYIIKDFLYAVKFALF